MFALEINFQDGVSQPETIFVRRPQALVGASDYAHVVVEDMKDLDYQIRLVRDLGRTFRCKPVMTRPDGGVPAFGDEVFDGSATLDLGRVRLQITAVDCDLILKDNEAPDRAGVRVLRQAFSARSPLFPAVVVQGAHPLVMSFPAEQSIYIGRSKQCALRLDSADISARHARLGFENGDFWVEDLGSTNGTFVDNQQISGRVSVKPGVAIVLGREISILGVTSADQISRVVAVPAAVEARPAAAKPNFPILVSLSQVARPARVVLRPGGKVSIGRDPARDMWLGAPHISRLHCAVAMDDRGEISVSDHSTNGTAHDGGILRKGDLLEVGLRPRVFDFGGGVTVALCFSTEEEERFREAHGALRAFSTAPHDAVPEAPKEVAVRARRQTAALGMEPVLAPPPGWRERFATFYESVGILGRIIIVSSVVVLAVVVVVIARLLVPVFG